MFKKRIWGIALVLVIITGCSNKEASVKEDYSKQIKEVKELISSAKWDEANKMVSEIPGDYDHEITIMNSYVKANLVLESEEVSGFEKNKNALRVLEHTEIDEDNKSELAKKAITLKTELERQVEEAIKVAEVEEREKVEEAYALWKELIKIGNDNASTGNNIKSVLSNKGNFISKYKEDALILYYYAVQNGFINEYWDNMNSQTGYNGSGNYDNQRSYGRGFADKHLLEVVEYLKEIDPNTNGASSFIPNVMSNLKTGLQNFFFINEAQWEQIYNSYDLDMRDEIEAGIEGRKDLSTMIPSVGMVSSDVELTSWGQPMKINKSTTVYGVSEQWVYEIKGSRKYVYLEDGIVTAVQDY
ncbi:hypothetical protein ACVBAX_13450 [Robertmurraya sp. GLU-23]